METRENQGKNKRSRKDSERGNSENWTKEDRYTRGDNGEGVIGQWSNKVSDELRVCKETRV